MCGPALKTHSEVLIHFIISFLFIILTIFSVHCTCQLVPGYIFCILSDPALKAEWLISGVRIMIGVNSTCPLRGSNYTFMNFSSCMWINHICLKLIHITVVTCRQLPWLLTSSYRNFFPGSDITVLEFKVCDCFRQVLLVFLLEGAPVRKYYHM